MQIPLRRRRPIIIPRIRITGPRESREVDLILDTGAVYTTLPWDLLTVLGYQPEKATKRVRAVTANGVVETPLIRVLRIQVEDLIARDVDVICHNIPELVEVSGLLGLSFIERFRTTLDYRRRRLEIS